jgi:hypothetical protein
VSGLQSSSRVPLQVLLDAVICARSALADRRHEANSLASIDDARARMLTTLEAYIAALRALRLPVPYGLRDELRVQRNAHRCGHGKVVRPRGG